MYVWVGGPVVSLSFVHKPGTTQSCGMSGVVEQKIRHSKIKRGGEERGWRIRKGSIQDVHL